MGDSRVGAGERVLIEFVSANPTGPLHVGHGRQAAYGATLANLLAATGFAVSREYYINDAGRQMDILGVSTWIRYLELCGEDTALSRQRLSRRLRAAARRSCCATLEGERLRVPAATCWRGSAGGCAARVTRNCTSMR